MPWTEHLWQFDGLLVSGQDFEFGLLALASVLSLVLVLSKHRAQTVTSFLAVLGWLSSNFQNAVKSAQSNGWGSWQPRFPSGFISHFCPVRPYAYTTSLFRSDLPFRAAHGSLISSNPSPP